MLRRTGSFQSRPSRLQSAALLSVALLAPNALFAQVPPTNGQRITPQTGNGVMSQNSTVRTHPDGAGGVFVVWHSVSGQMYFQRSTRSGGLPWGDQPKLLDNSGHSFFMSFNGAAGDFYVSVGSKITRVLADGSIAPGWPISLTAQLMAEDGLGGLVFIVGQSTAPHVNRLNPDGGRVWPAPGVELPFRDCLGPNSLPTYSAFAPLVPDGDGGAFVIWQAEDCDGFLRLYAAHVTSQGEIDNRWGPEDPSWRRRAKEIAFAPSSWRAAADGTGGLFVAWSKDIQFPPTKRFYVQRFDVDGAVHDGWPAEGRNFDSPAFFFVQSFSSASYPLRADGTGCVIVSLETNPTQAAQARLIRIGIEGDSISVMWNQLFDNTSADRPLSWIIEGSTVRVARHGIAPNSDIYGRVLNMSDGSVSCGDVTLCGANGSQWYPEVIPDTWGGAIVTWLDNRSAQPSHVYLSWFKEACVTPVTLSDIEIRADALGIHIGWSMDATSGAVCRVQRARSPDGPFLDVSGNIDALPGSHTHTYRDDAILEPGKYYYRIAYREEETWVTSPVYEVEVQPLALHVAPLVNPAVGEVKFRMTVPGSVPLGATLAIHDVMGRKVKSIRLPATSWSGHTASWDGRDNRGKYVASGAYFARLQHGGQSFVRRFIYLRASQGS